MAIPEIKDVTDTNLKGDGAFDKFMASTAVHIQEEFLKGRITGPEYSTVYLTGIQQAWNSALQFVLQREQVALVQAQTEQANVQTELAEQQKALVAEQIKKAEVEVNLIRAQVNKVNSEISLNTKQEQILEQERLKIIQDIALDLRKVNQEKLESQKRVLKLDQDIALDLRKTNQEILESAARIDKLEQDIALDLRKTNQDILLSQKQESKIDKEILLIGSQITKMSEEIRLTQAKVKSEQAQTDGGIFNDTSVIGRQTALYRAQETSYERDGAQKFAKLMVDSWSIRSTTEGEAVSNDTNNLSDGHVGSVIARLGTLNGINIEAQD